MLASVEAIRDLSRFRELLSTFTYREVQVKYKQSVMGLAWAVFMPVIIVASGALVRFAYSRVSGNPLTLDQISRVAVKSIPWAFVVAATRFGSMSLISNRNLVTKIYFPRVVFPVSAVVSQLVDFGVAWTLLTIILAIGPGLYWTYLWVPVLLAILVVLMCGTAVVLSAACLFFRDVKYIVEVVLTFAIFVTPVFYETTMFGEHGRLLMLNPVAPILEGLSMAVVDGRAPEPLWVAYSALCAVALVHLGTTLFRRVEPMFAETI